jgi:hypothetical protein
MPLPFRVPAATRAALFAPLLAGAAARAADAATTLKTGAATPAVSTAASPSAPIVAVPEMAGLEAALKQPGSPQQQQAFQQLFQQWLAREPEAAADYLRKVPPGNLRSQALLQALMRVAQHAPERALPLARALVRTPEENFVYSSVFDVLARRDLARAATQLGEIPAGDGRRNALRTLIAVWMQSDPNAALDWAKKLSAAEDRDVALEWAVQMLAQRDARRALEFAQQELEGTARYRAMSQAIDLLALTDPEGAAKLVDRIPPGDWQTNAACNVARALAARNIEGALAWIKTLQIDLTRWMALITILYQWSQTDQAAAARYVLELPPGTMLDFIAPQMAPLLAVNPPDAIHWAEALPSPSARDAALIAVAQSWAQRAPAEAVRWAASLKEEPLRTNATTSAFTPWLQQDPPAANAWLERADFPRATKSVMRRAHLIEP